MSGLLKISVLVALIMIPIISQRWSGRQLVERTVSVLVVYWFVAIYIIPRLGG